MNIGRAKEVTISEADLEEFIKALDKCKANVYLVTDEGDRINLKSQFCRIIGLHHIISGGRFSVAIWNAKTMMMRRCFSDLIFTAQTIETVIRKRSYMQLCVTPR